VRRRRTKFPAVYLKYKLVLVILHHHSFPPLSVEVLIMLIPSSANYLPLQSATGSLFQGFAVFFLLTIFVICNGLFLLSEATVMSENIIEKYEKIQNISQLLGLKNTTEILFMKTMGRESILRVAPFSSSDAVRSTALLLKIQKGLLFHHGKVHCPAVVDVLSQSIFTFHQWELTISSDNELTSYTHIKEIKQFDKVMSFSIPWGSVFSHIVGTMLPKLSFTCEFLSARSEIMIIVNSKLAHSLFCISCPYVCDNSSGISNRFIFMESDNNFCVQANELFYPLFVSLERDLKACSYCSGGEGGNNVYSVPPNTILPLNTLHYSDSWDTNITSYVDVCESRRRPLLYISRSRALHHRYRLMEPHSEGAALKSLCNLLSSQSGVFLSVFNPTNDYKLDQAHMRCARAVLSPHSGALANILFAPSDAVVFEIVNYDGPGRANFFYASLSRALNLRHVAIKPRTFDMWNPNVPIIINSTYIVEIFKQHLPEINEFPPDFVSNQLDIKQRAQCLALNINGRKISEF
jgi:hypothetical protein